MALKKLISPNSPLRLSIRNITTSYTSFQLNIPDFNLKSELSEKAQDLRYNSTYSMSHFWEMAVVRLTNIY